MEIKEKFSVKTEVFDWLEAICVSIVAVILLFSLAFRSTLVEGYSMLPTLDNLDRVVIVNPVISKIEQGDVVVVTQPNNISQPLIKRVIATEGQTIDIDFNTGDVFVDGFLLEESYIREKIQGEPYDSVIFPFTVSEGCVFVMGDNRNESSDSRNAGIGEIDTRYIMGEAVLRIFPLDSFGFIE